MTRRTRKTPARAFKSRWAGFQPPGTGAPDAGRAGRQSRDVELRALGTLSLEPSGRRATTFVEARPGATVSRVGMAAICCSPKTGIQIVSTVDVDQTRDAWIAASIALGE